MRHCRHAVIGSILAAVFSACNNPEASTTAASTTTTAGTGDTTPTSSTTTTPTFAGDTTASSATATATPTTADATTDCPAFIGCSPDPDLQCDPFAQDCPEGQKCAAWADNGGNSWNATKCVPVQPDPDAPGDPCTTTAPFGVSGEDSCAKGSMCWEVDPSDGHGTCIALCTGSAEAAACADACDYCVIANQGVLNLCLPQCDPLADDCSSDRQCLPSGDDGGFFCIPHGERVNGLFGYCEFFNACDSGLFCGDPSDAVECDPQIAGCCLPFCDPNGPACPGAGQECLPWPSPAQCHPVHFCGLPD